MSKRLGTPLMPWQRLVADVAGEMDPETGLLVYREVRITIPRQNGKTTFALSKLVDRCVNWKKPQRCVSTAQTGKDARDKFVDDFLPLLDASAFAPHYKARLTNGNEAVKWTNGSLWNVVPPTETASHGKSIDEGLIDEAFALQDGRVEQAIRPAMITKPDPQLLIVSTAGIPDKSPYLWQKVESGRQLVEDGVDRGVAYFEWSAPDEAPIDDPETWRACMPAMGITINENAIRDELLSMRQSEFRRAYLNQWVRSALDQIIPEEDWERCGDSKSKLGPSLSFAIDVSPNQSNATIAVAGPRLGDGLMTVEIVESRPGTAWVTQRVLDLRATWGPKVIAMDFAGPAGALKSELEASGLEIRSVNAREHAQACGELYAMATDGHRVRHLDQPILNAALADAGRRLLADAWAWSRKASSGDISPLVAATLAMWAHAQPEIEVPKPTFAF